MNEPRSGEICRTIDCGGGYEIRKVVRRVAYPRNGNVHNPTVYYGWDVYLKGRLLVPESTLKAAQEAVADCKLNPE